MLNVDTHVLLHAVAGVLRQREADLLRGHQWSISAVVLWEMAKLNQLGRVAVDFDDPDVLKSKRVPLAK